MKGGTLPSLPSGSSNPFTPPTPWQPKQPLAEATMNPRCTGEMPCVRQALQPTIAHRAATTASKIVAAGRRLTCLLLRPPG